jgi:hypothetical protein
MTEALFSQFLMVDRTAASSSGRTSVRAAKEQSDISEIGRDDQNLHEALAKAFLQAVEQTMPGISLKSGSAIEFAEMAASFADIAIGQSVILQLKTNLAEGHKSAVRTFLESVVRVSGKLEENRLEAAIGKLAEVILPDDLAAARGVLAADNLELRDRFIAEVPQLTSAEIGAHAGLRTKNPYATAARWKKNGDIFSVQHRGVEYFPSFQFRDGRPHPTIRKVLDALPAYLSAWQKALWFVSTNGWLGDEAPTSLLDDANLLVATAKREGQEVVG